MVDAGPLENNNNNNPNYEIGDIDDDNEQDEDRIKPSPRAFESYKFLAKLVNQIYRVCVCLQQAVREYALLDEGDQRQVWEDLVGKEGKRRIFVQGQELLTFAQEYEPPTMVQDALEQLEQYITQMPANQKQAYTQAVAQATNYVKDRAFCLKFLRAEKFNVTQAAVRLTRHFEEKQKLFGADLLGREITWTDLDPDDQEALSNAYLQVLSTLDQSNRRVVFYYKAISNTKGTSDCYKKRENIVRRNWTLLAAVLLYEDSKLTWLFCLFLLS